MRKLPSLSSLSALLSLASLSSLMSCGLVSIKPEAPKLNDRIYILGPESTPFCGGVVEMWARMDTTSWQRDVELFVKASAPGDGGGFELSNEHIVVEMIQEGAVQRRRKLKDIKSIEFKSSTTLDTGSGTNVGRWKFSIEGLDPDTGVKVFLKPFKGCAQQGQAIMSMILKDRAYP